MQKFARLNQTFEIALELITNASVNGMPIIKSSVGRI